jgi:hypothetical protein
VIRKILHHLQNTTSRAPPRNDSSQPS